MSPGAEEGEEQRLCQARPLARLDDAADSHAAMLPYPSSSPIRCQRCKSRVPASDTLTLSLLTAAEPGF